MKEYMVVLGMVCLCIIVYAVAITTFLYYDKYEMVHVQDALDGQEISLSKTHQVICKPTTQTKNYMKLMNDLRILNKLREDANEQK